MDHVRVGIIGAGAIARRAYLPGLSPPDSRQAKLARPPYDFGGCAESRIVALADVNYDLALRRAEEFAVPQVYEDWTQLATNPEIDAVCITTPNFLHAEMAIGCLENGKHVMVEKPLATSLSDIDQMIAIAGQNRKILMTHFNWRFLPTSEAAKDILDSDAIGQVHFIRSHAGIPGVSYWSADSAWRLHRSEAGQGAVLDMAIHLADLVRWIGRKEVASVTAVTKRIRHSADVDDIGVGLLEFTDGTIGTLEGSWITNPWEISMSFYAEGGDLKMNWSADPPVCVNVATPQRLFLNDNLPPGAATNGAFVPELSSRSRYGSPIAYFVSCVKTGFEPFVTPTDARASLEIILALYRSAAEHSAVDLPLRD